jgi:hypothetical protein
MDQAGERPEPGSFFVSNKISVKVNEKGHSYDHGTVCRRGNVRVRNNAMLKEHKIENFFGSEF